MSTKVCNRCGIEKSLEDFPFKNLPRNKRQAVCKTCTAERSADWYENNKDHHRENVYERKKRLREEARDYVYRYLLRHSCELCGESDPRVLEFHHVGGKDRAISNMIAEGYSIELLAAEMGRCQVLCANCHRKLTSDERGWFKGRRSA